MSFFYKYIKGLKRIDDTDTDQLKIGKIFHSILEGEPIDYGLPAKLQLSIEASADYVMNEFRFKSINNKTITELNKASKTEFELDVDGFTGFIDLVIEQEDGDILVDYKYVADLTYAQSYKLSDQTKLYPYLYELQTGRKVKQFTYLCVTKPTIRQKQTESEEAYINRVKEWYGDFDTKIAEIVIEKELLEEMTEEIKQDLHFFKHMIENEIFYKDTGSCMKYNKQCPYYPICYNEPNAETNYKIEMR